MKFYLLVILTVVTAVYVKASNADPCGGYMSCTDCVTHQLCGWCSLPVIFPGNITGPQCAGFSPNGSTPFACNGIYSTDTCIQGYVCNLRATLPPRAKVSRSRRASPRATTRARCTTATRPR